MGDMGPVHCYQRRAEFNSSKINHQWKQKRGEIANIYLSNSRKGLSSSTSCPAEYLCQS